MDLKKQDVKMWTGFIWLRTGINGSSCEYGNGPLGSIKGGEFFGLTRVAIAQRTKETTDFRRP
jgi:hypothetical protein